MTEADGIKSDKAVAAPDGEGGVGPRPFEWWNHKEPKRMRGYYRALKRGEPWAVYKKQQHEWLTEATRKLSESILKPNAFFGLLDRSDEPKDPRPIEAMGLSSWLPTLYD